jgi:hypothetical protein
MSKHKDVPAAGAVAIDAAPPAKPEKFLPLPLWIAFAALLGLGAVLMLTRNSRLESSLYSNISEADASGIKQINGLEDSFGLVKFQRNNDSVATLLSICKTNPDVALRIFRRSVDDGPKSARLIALYSAFFIGQQVPLQDEDIKRVTSRLDPEKEKDEEVRRAAQRALSDLVVITDPASAQKYESLPPNIAKPTGDYPAHKTQTREEKVDDKTILRIRWSNPDLALEWWKTHSVNAKWDTARKALVLP